MTISTYLEEIIENLKTSQNLILTAQPGTGKTTILPPALLKHFTKKIIVLEPRRIAAVSAAQYICETQSYTLTKEVGYHVRLDKKTSESTQLIFMTEKLFLNYFQNDPELKGFDCIIFDEFHERSASTDIILGAIKDLQTLGSTIKTLVMSATLDTASLSSYLNAKVIDVPGKLFPIEVIYSKKNQHLKIDDFFFDQLKIAFQEVKNKSKKDILVFLPGAGEIQKAIRIFESFAAAEFQIQSLYGQMNLSEQKAVLKNNSNKRRIIFSTNVAESAITIDGVDAVIDSGLEKSSQFDLDLQLQQLQLERVSLTSAVQRAGRSARQKNGIVYKMWTTLDERSMSKVPKNPFFKEDLSYEFLYLSSLKSQLGFNSWSEFSWYEKPKDEFFESYFNKLLQINCIDKNFNLTDVGTDCLKIPFLPEISQGLWLANRLGCAEIMSFIFTYIENNINESHPANQHSDCDLLPVIEDILLNKKNLSFAEQRLLQISFNTFKQLKKFTYKESESTYFNTIIQQFQNVNFKSQYKQILLETFVTRLCRRRPNDTTKAQMVNGVGVEVKSHVASSQSDFFIILSGQKKSQSHEVRATSISGVDFSLIEKKLSHLFKIQDHLVFENETFYIDSNTYLNKLAIKNPSRKKPTREQMSDLLQDYVVENWDVLGSKVENLQQWIKRFEFFEYQLQKTNLVETSIKNLDSEFSFNLDFKTAVARDITFGKTNLEEILNSDWKYFLNLHLPEKIKAVLEKEVPDSFQIPNGKNLKISYAQLERPMVSAKIQDIFSVKETPTVFFNSIPLIFDLLGPNYRSVQITADLKTFWKTSYLEIRKELRPRYPKHNWPESV